MAGHRAKRRPLFLAAAIAALAAVGVWAAIAMAATEDVVSNLQCCTFEKSTYHSDQGEIPNYVNPSTAEEGSHNVTARDKLGGKPLFRSKTIGIGKSVPIDGLQYLPAGTYKFFCTIHPDSMKGSFVISNKGTPVARPEDRRLDPGSDAQQGARLGQAQGQGQGGDEERRDLDRGAQGRQADRQDDRAEPPRRGHPDRQGGAQRPRPQGAAGRQQAAAVSATGSVPFGLPDSGRRTLR